MPSDAIHIKYAKWTIAVGGIILYGFGVDPVHIVGIAAFFMFCVMYLSPDLDMANTEPTKRWGGLKIAWSPFEKMVAHRSRWSHGWILGFITVHVYFLGLLIVATAVLRGFWLPLIEPLIDTCNSAIDDIVCLNISPVVTSFATCIVLTALAAFWHHKLLDTFFKN